MQGLQIHHQWQSDHMYTLLWEGQSNSSAFHLGGALLSHPLLQHDFPEWKCWEPIFVQSSLLIYPEWTDNCLQKNEISNLIEFYWLEKWSALIHIHLPTKKRQKFWLLIILQHWQNSHTKLFKKAKESGLVLLRNILLTS